MGRRAKEKMSIVTVVSFDGSLKSDYKTVMVHTSGSTATVIQLGVSSRDGTNFIPSPALRQILETNGSKATEATKENGND